METQSPALEICPASVVWHKLDRDVPLQEIYEIFCPLELLSIVHP